MKNIFGAFFIIGLYINSVAQNIILNSAGEAADLALEKNLDFQKYLINQQKAEIEYKQAKSYRLPTITGTFNGQRNIDLATTPLPAEIFGGEPGQTINTQFGQEYNYNAGINIYKEMFNRETILQKELSHLNKEVQEVSKKLYEDLLIEQVSVYYYSALIARRAIELAENDLESAESIRELTGQKFREGIIDAITLNTSKINRNSVRQSLNASRQMELQSLTELKKLYGMRPADTLILSEKLDYLLPKVFTIEELSGNLKLESTRLELQQADTRVKISQSSLLPTLSLNTYIGRQQFRNDFGLSFGNNAWTNYSFTSLNLSIPIFSGLNNRRNIKVSKLNQQIAFNEKEKTAINAQLADQQLIEEYRLSLDDARSALETFRLYKENQKLTFQKYEEGLISFDSYLKVFEDYIKAENTYLNSISKVYAYYSQIIPRI